MIWSRTLTNSHKKNGDAEIIVGPLSVDSESGDFICQWKIKGLSREREGRAFGIDQIQATLLAMQMIRQILETSEEYLSGNLHWGGGLEGNKLGLPNL